MTISGLATTAGAECERTAAQGYEVAIDAIDIDAVRPFWEAVLAYHAVQHRPGGPINLVDPARIGPTIWFQQMDAPRPQRNRIHVDVTVAHDVAEARVAAALAAGGRLVSAAQQGAPRSGCSPTPRATRRASARGSTAGDGSDAFDLTHRAGSR